MFLHMYGAVYMSDVACTLVKNSTMQLRLWYQHILTYTHTGTHVSTQTDVGKEVARLNCRAYLLLT